MTRVESVLAHPGSVVREHGFENHPAGTRPHTTAPLDYLIAALAAIFRGLPERTSDAARDLAGAWISPLLGVGTLLFLAGWAQRERLPFRWAIIGSVATSPILAHGFALGRPDHQSLLVLCLALALAAEISQWRRPSRVWGLAGGAAWALALWTSLYEPLLLLAAVIACGLIFDRPTLLRRERLPGLALGSGLLLLALWVEGVRVEFPDAAGRELFQAWSREIGELRSAPPWSPVLLSWTGWSLLVAPALLWLAWRRRAAAPHFSAGGIALALACWLILVWVMTCWQVRWGYFLALVAALTLPWQLHGALGQRPHLSGYLIWLLAMLPVLGGFERRVDVFIHGSAADSEQAREAQSLHEVARFLEREATTESSTAPRGVLAPWWDSPALSYWSKQPAVAGSSHESLSGIADAARFFLLPAGDAHAARELLRARRVRWVVVDDPARVLPTSASLLGRPVPERGNPVLGESLARDPLSAQPFLRLVFANPDLKVYAVEPMLSAQNP